MFFKEKFTFRNLLGFVVAFGAGALIVWNGKANFNLNPLGDLLILLSVIAWSAYTLVGRNVVRKYSPVLITRTTLLVGAVCTLPFFIMEVSRGKLAGAPLSVALVVLYLGVMVTALGFTIWVHCTRVLGIVRTSNLLYFQCVITMFCAWLTIHEPITLFLIGCTGAVLLGVYLSNLAPGGKK